MNFINKINNRCNEFNSLTEDKTSAESSCSPSISLGRSSTASIPWAEDAIRQNSEEWNRIERMFYREEGLTTDKKLREEILEWMEAFPHIRISGKQSSLYCNSKSPSTETNSGYVEVIAIDPPKSRVNNKYIRQRKLDVIQNLHIDITKNLKISPRPAMKKSVSEKSKDLSHDNNSSTFMFKIPETHGVRLINLQSVQPNVSFSASHVRIPPILSIKIVPSFKNTQRLNNETKSAAIHGLKTRVTLPPIDVNKIIYKNEVMKQNKHEKNSNLGRSISAAVCKKRNCDKINDLEKFDIR